MILRIITSPFVLAIIMIAYIYHGFNNWSRYLRYGGEWSTYSENDRKTILDVYQILKHKYVGKCKICKTGFNDLDIETIGSRPEDICSSCFTSNA